MKIKIKDRILAALLAILLLAGAAAIVAQTFFSVPVTETVKKLTEKNDTLTTKILPGAIAAVLLVLAICCLTVLFRHRKKKDRFIRQVTEGGELQIGLDALSNLVGRCLEQHPEITPEKVSLENERNSLTVNIAGNVSGGISIPLTVSQLQKQIKQYVTACSGVEVKNVRVTIRNTGEDAKDAPFAIESPAAVPRLKSGTEEEEHPAPEAVQTAAAPEKPAIDVPETPAKEQTTIFGMGGSYEPAGETNILDETEDDRPLHQRLFSQPEEPCIVPCPPEMNNAGQEKTIDTTVTAETETVGAETEEVVSDADESDAGAEATAWNDGSLDDEPTDAPETQSMTETEEPVENAEEPVFGDEDAEYAEVGETGEGTDETNESF